MFIVSIICINIIAFLKIFWREFIKETFQLKKGNIFMFNRYSFHLYDIYIYDIYNIYISDFIIRYKFIKSAQKIIFMQDLEKKKRITI